MVRLLNLKKSNEKVPKNGQAGDGLQRRKIFIGLSEVTGVDMVTKLTKMLYLLSTCIFFLENSYRLGGV